MNTCNFVTKKGICGKACKDLVCYVHSDKKRLARKRYRDSAKGSVEIKAYAKNYYENITKVRDLIFEPLNT